MPETYNHFHTKSFVCLHPAVICSLPLHAPPAPPSRHFWITFHFPDCASIKVKHFLYLTRKPEALSVRLKRISGKDGCESEGRSLSCSLRCLIEPRAGEGEIPDVLQTPLCMLDGQHSRFIFASAWQILRCPSLSRSLIIPPWSHV